MNVLIVAGGEVDLPLLKSLLPSSDRVIALDRGLDYLLAVDALPDYLLGDMDSIKSDIPSHISVQTFPPEKGFTDLEAGLIFAQSLNYDLLTVVGAGGTRMDHFLSAVFLLSEMSGEVHYLDTHNRIRMLKEITILKKGDYPFFSVLPLCPSIISIEGAKYNLDRKEMIPSESLGLSNEWKEDSVQVMLHSGRAFIIESRD